MGMTMRVAGEQPSNAERQKWGLSHQLLFDFECMIEGFIGLLADLKSRYTKVAVLARKINHQAVMIRIRIRSSHFSARFGTRWAGGVHSRTTKSTRLVSVVCKSSGRCRKRLRSARN